MRCRRHDRSRPPPLHFHLLLAPPPKLEPPPRASFAAASSTKARAPSTHRRDLLLLRELRLRFLALHRTAQHRPKIGNLALPIGRDEDIVRLEVPVNHVERVQMLHADRNVSDQRKVACVESEAEAAREIRVRLPIGLRM